MKCDVARIKGRCLQVCLIQVEPFVTELLNKERDGSVSLFFWLKNSVGYREPAVLTNMRLTLKNLAWLLIFVPAVCSCLLVLMAIFHYLHVIESADLLVNMMFALLGLNLVAGVAIAIRTSGNLPYLLFGNLLFFIIFVFSIATVNTHNCEHHSTDTRPQFSGPMLGEQLDVN